MQVGSVGCCCYGENPLAFKACTNQLNDLDYLVTKTLQGSGCRVQGAGCRVQGSGFRVQVTNQLDVF